MAAPVYNIAIIQGSQRPVRAGPQVATFVQQTIQSHLSSTSRARPIALEVVDVAALQLPLLDEPGVPSQIRDPAGYVHEHTRAWSRRIAAFDAFVFVTPQYNWGIPAGLKNAIDYLFHEWKGKPAMIVAYGGHGGDKCAAALKVVLGGGIDMRVVQDPVCLSFPGREFLVKAATGGALGLDASQGEGPWSDRRPDILTGFEELVGLLSGEEPAKA